MALKIIPIPKNLIIGITDWKLSVNRIFTIKGANRIKATANGIIAKITNSDWVFTNSLTLLLSELIADNLGK